MQKLKLAGKKFVVLAESEYRKLERRANAVAKPAKRRPRLSPEDRYDSAQAKRVLSDPAEISIPWEQAKLQLWSKR